MKILSNKAAVKKLTSFIPKDIKNLAISFNMAGFDLFLVGGCIRDVFLNKTPKDFDVATNANPNQVKNILRNNNIDFQEQGVDFGVVVAKLSDDVEIATFRTEIASGNGNGHDTKVKVGCTIEEDVQRRDLTINGLFFNMSTNTIVDLVGGINDLKNNIIRTIGNPNDRFSEDNLRKLRTIRFASRLNFTIEKNTFDAIVNDTSLNISKERIFEELKNAFNKKHSLQLLVDLLIDSKLANEIFEFEKESMHCWFNDITFDEFIFIFVQDKSKDDIKSILNKNKILSSIDVCLFFKDLQTLLINNDVIDPMWFFKKKEQFHIDNINISNHTKIDWLMNFKPDKNLVQKLIQQGLKNAELGKVIKEHNLNLFKNQFFN